jgi:hypothetical protein
MRTMELMVMTTELDAALGMEVDVAASRASPRRSRRSSRCQEIGTLLRKSATAPEIDLRLSPTHPKPYSEAL